MWSLNSSHFCLAILVGCPSCARISRLIGFTLTSVVFQVLEYVVHLDDVGQGGGLCTLSCLLAHDLSGFSRRIGQGVIFFYSFMTAKTEKSWKGWNYFGTKESFTWWWLPKNRDKAKLVRRAIFTPAVRHSRRIIENIETISLLLNRFDHDLKTTTKLSAIMDCSFGT